MKDKIKSVRRLEKEKACYKILHTMERWAIHFVFSFVAASTKK